MIKKIIKDLICFKDLEEDTAYSVMKYIIEGNATDAQISSFLTALKMKTETVSEIAGFYRAMIENAQTIKIDRQNAVDTCGTGGDCKNTFNISTASSFIAAGAGVLIAKHGNRGLSSKCGSADVLEALGVNIEISARNVERCINSIGIGFMFAPVFHKAMAAVAKARKDIAVKSVFNILGPLTNPAMAQARVIGVYEKRLIEIIAFSLKKLGVSRAFVVHGDDGMDEFSVCSLNHVAELRDSEIITYILDPVDLGIKRYRQKDLLGTGPKENARILADILSGKEKGAKRESAVINSAAAIIAGGKAESLKDAIELARYSIESGSALKKMNELICFTNNL
jgi:anthranilate phosphoribosyltransferase